MCMIVDVMPTRTLHYRVPRLFCVQDAGEDVDVGAMGGPSDWCCGSTLLGNATEQRIRTKNISLIQPAKQLSQNSVP